jgi:hypothetical protein
VELSIGHIVPVDRENRWSDLLAVLVEADPDSAGQALGCGTLTRPVGVRREARAGLKDRVDLLVHAGGELHAVVEVKVFAGIGPGQLHRYRQAFPDPHHHILIFPARLALDTADQAGWCGLTWEQVLGSFAASSHPWVAATAKAWLGYLDSAVPAVEGQTRWNDLREGEDFVIAMRARMSWVFGRLRPPEPITHDLVGSSAGVSWVTRMHRPAARESYRVIAEAEENLPVRDYPRTAGPNATNVRGPSIKVCLLQHDVATSAGFDWDYLLALWNIMDTARGDWVTTPAKPKSAHDRANWKAMIGKGGPRHLGIGFGEAQARRRGECMFGARLQLPADVELAAVVQALHEIGQLVQKMADHPYPEHAPS